MYEVVIEEIGVEEVLNKLRKENRILRKKIAVLKREVTKGRKRVEEWKSGAMSGQDSGGK